MTCSPGQGWLSCQAPPSFFPLKISMSGDYATSEMDFFLFVKSFDCQRFCYVIFDGGKCMEELKKRGTLNADEDFLKEFCPDIVKGMEKLCGWVDFWKNYSS